MIIAIDGYSATGKSTIAKLLAQKLGFQHLNSGLIYRALSLNLLNNGIGFDNYIEEIEKVKSMTENIEINLIDLERESFRLKAPKVSAFGSQIAKLDFVRESASKALRVAAQNSNIIVEGRDIGTVIFPDADIKFFFIADSDVRTKRLSKERNNNNLTIIKQEIETRDKEDENRAISPLKPAFDSIEIDTSLLTITTTLDVLEKYVNEIKE